MVNRVYGLLGIGAKMANWNAGFDGRPKQTNDGMIYGSDKALKYSIRHFWKENQETVLYYKRYAFKKDKKGKETEEVTPSTLKDIYERTFNSVLSPKETNMKEVLINLLSALDIKNFGGTFAVEGFNTSITGAVQIGQGFNVDRESEVQIQDILSPFPSGEEKGQTSVGKQIMLDEGHYVYPFSINPRNYEDLENLLEIEKIYTNEVYEKFKKSALQGATFFNSCSKAGCYNEFGLFVELKEDSLLYLEPFDNMLMFSKENEKPMYDFGKISERLEMVKDQIDQVVLYYNPYQIDVKGTNDFVLKNIFTEI